MTKPPKGHGNYDGAKKVAEGEERFLEQFHLHLMCSERRIKSKGVKAPGKLVINRINL